MSLGQQALDLKNKQRTINIDIYGYNLEHTSTNAS